MHAPNRAFWKKRCVSEGTRTQKPVFGQVLYKPLHFSLTRALAGCPEYEIEDETRESASNDGY